MLISERPLTRLWMQSPPNQVNASFSVVQEAQARHMSTTHSVMLYVHKDRLSSVLPLLGLQRCLLMVEGHHTHTSRSQSRSTNLPHVQSKRIAWRLNFFE